MYVLSDGVELYLPTVPAAPRQHSHRDDDPELPIASNDRPSGTWLIKRPSGVTVGANDGEELSTCDRLSR